MKREVFLDRLKVFATCAVVFMHTLTGVTDYADKNQYPQQFQTCLILMDLICWCVPVFLIISGYLFLNPSKRISARDMVTKYCRRIVLALFLFGVPYACMELVAAEKAFRPAMIGEGIVMVLQGRSWAHLWYLYLIFGLYLITPLLKLLLMKMPRNFVWILQFALLIVFSILPFAGRLLEIESLSRIPSGGIYFFYYICGYLFVTYRGTKEEKTPQKVRIVLLGITVLLTCFVILSRLSGEYQLQMAYNYPSTVCFAVLLFAIGYTAKRKENKNTGIWEKASAISFAVYLTHPVFLNIYYKYLHLMPFRYPMWWSVPLYFIGTLLPTILVAVILRTISVLRKNVL